MKMSSSAFSAPPREPSEVAALDAESAEVLGNIKQLLNTEKTHA